MLHYESLCITCSPSAGGLERLSDRGLRDVPGEKRVNRDNCELKFRETCEALGGGFVGDDRGTRVGRAGLVRRHRQPGLRGTAQAIPHSLIRG